MAHSTRGACTGAGPGSCDGENPPGHFRRFQEVRTFRTLQSVSNEFKPIYFFIFRKQGQGKGFTGLPSAGTFSGGTSRDVPWMGATLGPGVTMV